MPATAKDLLQSASYVIATPGWWTRDTLATTERGSPVEPSDERACSFCLLGALDAAKLELRASYKEYKKARDALYEVLYQRGIISFNDAPQTTAIAVARKLWEAQRHVSDS